VTIFIFLNYKKKIKKIKKNHVLTRGTWLIPLVYYQQK